MKTKEATKEVVKFNRKSFRQLRKEAELSLSEVAKKIGQRHGSYISSLEQGRITNPRPNTIARLAKALHTSQASLIAA